MKRFLNTFVCLVLLGGTLAAQVSRKNVSEPLNLVRLSKAQAAEMRQAVASSVNPTAKSGDKATITLDIQVDWGDGSGYQLLLDADHNTYGNQIPSYGQPMSASGDADAAVYAEFEYKIPENATGSVSDNTWLTGVQKKSIEIEPGVYDFVLCAPLIKPDKKILIVWDGGVADDFEFKAGSEYIFTIEAYGWNEKCTVKEVSPNDLALIEILTPENDVDIENGDVTVKLANQGSAEVNTFTLGYSVNGSEMITEEVNQTLASGEEMEYTFNQKFNPEKHGAYEIRVQAMLDGDGNASNDELAKTIINGCDLSIEQVVEPVSGKELNFHDVTVRIKNNGRLPVDSFTMWYKVNRNDSISEMVPVSVEGGSTYDFTFSVPANLTSYGKYNISTSLFHPYDVTPANDTLSVMVENMLSVPTEPLFFCDFDDTAANLKEAWTVIDANGDENTWQYALDIVDDVYWYGGGHALYRTVYGTAGDDYLMNKEGISMKPGKHYIRFNYAAYSPYYVENLRLLFGNQPDPEKMEVLSEKVGFLASPDGYYTEAVNFEVEEAGEYYFAFHAFSGTKAIGIKLDNVIVDTGVNQGSPNLVVEKVLLPLSGCGLGEEPIGARLSNNGTSNVYEFKLSYSINGQEPVEEVFEDTLLMGQTKDVYFETVADLSAFDTYVFRVEGTVIPKPGQKAETYLTDNNSTDSIYHHDAIELPFYTDFRNVEDRRNWDFEDGSWFYREKAWWIEDPEYLQTIYCDEEDPLVSRCFQLEKDVYYRLTYEYICGYNSPYQLIPESFEIRYGQVGTPIEEWKLLKRYEQHYTNEEFVVEDLAFQCPSDGQFSLAIIPITAFTTIHFKEVTLEQTPAYDLRLSEVNLASPTLMPVEQTVSPVTMEYTVQNKGFMEAGDIQVKITANGEEVISQDMVLGGIEESVEGVSEIMLDGVQAGTLVNLEVKATLVENADQDDDSDNHKSLSLTVTDSVMAYDRVTEGMYDFDYAIGSTGMVTCGIPFYFPITDTLTGISIGWAPKEEDMDITLHIYRWDTMMERQGDLLYERTCLRGTQGGQTEYPVRPMILEAGFYMIAVSFENSISLIADLNMDAEVYILENGAAYEQERLGCPSIRAIFGHGANVVGTDASATGFTRPATQGSFSSQEMIVVKVSNLGSKEEIIPVNVTVNGERLETAKVRLAAYTSGEVGLIADLSKEEFTYEIVAWTELEGDEDITNDTCRMTVHTESPADPYMLDFEQCSDFSISYLNPQWTMLDVDKNYPYGMDGVNFPYAGTPFAFIVFNPEQTTPPMQASTAHQPFSGKRFGASFSGADGANDDWLISPKLRLPKQNAMASFEVKSYTDAYGLESYNVLVSTESNDPDDFVQIGQTRTAPAAAWEHVEIDLSEYAGDEIYFAIQCVSNNAFMFMVDDVEISRPASSESETEMMALLQLYPNPSSSEIHISSYSASIVGISICDVLGSVVFQDENIKTHQVTYNVENLPSGIYLARVQTTEGISVLKFVVR